MRAYATKLSLTNENRTYLDHKMITSKRITHYSTGFAHIVILITQLTIPRLKLGDMLLSCLRVHVFIILATYYII